MGPQTMSECSTTGLKKSSEEEAESTVKSPVDVDLVAVAVVVSRRLLECYWTPTSVRMWQPKEWPCQGRVQRQR